MKDTSRWNSGQTCKETLVLVAEDAGEIVGVVHVEERLRGIWGILDQKGRLLR
jgi:predicted N-acetyltransferase YhbS